jgi:hypothetical protein
MDRVPPHHYLDRPARLNMLWKSHAKTHRLRGAQGLHQRDYAYKRSRLNLDFYFAGYAPRAPMMFLKLGKVLISECQPHRGHI